MGGEAGNEKRTIDQVAEPAPVELIERADLQVEPKVVDTVLVDMDGVLCDFERHFVAWWERAYPEAKSLPVADRKTHYVFDDPSGVYDAERTNKLITAPGFYETIPEIPGAVEALLQMEQEFGVQVVICTAPWCSSGGGCCPKCDVEQRCEREKRAWMAARFGTHWASPQKLICIKDKSQVPGLLLIDDKPDPRRGGKGPASWQHVVFSQPFNVNNPSCEGKVRLNSWAEWREVLSPLLVKASKQAAENLAGVGEEALTLKRQRIGQVDLKTSVGNASEAEIAQMFSRFFPEARDEQWQTFAKKWGKLQVSMADIEGYLMFFTDEPDECINKVDEYVKVQPHLRAQETTGYSTPAQLSCLAELGA